MRLEEERSLMVSRQLEARGIHDFRVLRAMGRVPRHLFVSESNQASAYADFPLPIGNGQTISQPYMVALMTQHLNLKGTERIMEIGTGSGYQAAILAELAKEVISIERIPRMAHDAERLLDKLGYNNVRVIVGDGTKGWMEATPYQGILVTAGAPRAPNPLLEQLDIDGRLVVPVGNRINQVLEIHIRRQSDVFKVIRDTACRFVDLIGEHGW